MKWVTFISCLFWIGFTEPKNVPRRYRDVEQLINIAGFIPLPEKIVKLGSTALLSQYVQNARFNDMEKLAKDVVELAKVCDTNSQSEPRCQKYAGYVCVDLLCQEPGLAEKYGFTKCCAAFEGQRHSCFLSHKNDTPGFIPSFQNPNAEQVCKQFQDHRDLFQAHFVHEVARRYPTTSLHLLIAAGHDYNEVLTACCQEAGKEACFSAKVTMIIQKLQRSSHEQHQMCTIKKKYGSNTMFPCEFAELSEKFPKASFSILYHLSRYTQYMHEELCKGDTLQGFFIQADILKDICSHRLEISAKLDDCCGRPLLEQPNCIAAVENDDRPADVSPVVKAFIENKVMQCHSGNSTTDWAKHLLLSEYSRGRAGFSPELTLRLYEGYMDLLHKCCKTEKTEECATEGEKQLENQAVETLNSKNDTCSLYDSGDSFSYQDMLLPEFTKRVPQLSFEDLYKHTKQFTEGVHECCHSNDSQKLICIEGKVDLVLGDICRSHVAHPINPQLGRCCREPSRCRLACFQSLDADADCVPIPFSPEFHEDLCSDKPENQHIQKQSYPPLFSMFTDLTRNQQETRFLVDLIKSKPTITTDQRQTVTTDFNGLLEKCCQAENHEECFKEEGPRLVENTKAALGVH
ncbi:hypothetical protein lerEdw1_012987 [Lerista edwardsae]|nr:hypothetical protein lerEdw1_012987 [Lerista edwardsae]